MLGPDNPLKAFRKWLVLILSDPEELVEKALPDLPDDLPLETAVKNHVWHAVKQLHVSVIQLNAKLNFQNLLLLALVGAAVSPFIDNVISQLFGG